MNTSPNPASITANDAPTTRAGWNGLGDQLHAQGIAILTRANVDDLHAARLADVRFHGARAAWQRAETAPL
ncbi:hypothetical protein [Streptomyces sp. NPDC002402]